MSDIAIRVENLSKRYRIGAKEEQHDTFAGALLHQLRNPARNLRRLRRLSKFSENGTSPAEEDDVIWALKDVSFEVKRGEVVGIIGRNGAGKSTLLKILSRITHPTSGRVELHGRVSSLLEVGTGFHPELSGRENIYLNGTILGMRKAEIDRKFDEIVDFSGVEKFIDTPVKRYSSGMRVRLAFSVAAHLEPEILLVDEVLAVGDAAFQRKCLGKMGEVAREGRTVLFVSHNVDAISAITKRCIWLERGKILRDSESDSVIEAYLFQESMPLLKSDKGVVDILSIKRNFLGEDNVMFSWIQLVDALDRPRIVFYEEEDIVVRIGIKVVNVGKFLQVGCSVNYDRFNRSIFTVASPVIEEELQEGEYSTSFSIQPNHLRYGKYTLVLKAFINGIRCDQVKAVQITILPREREGAVVLEKWVAGPVNFGYSFSDFTKLNSPDQLREL